MASTELQHAWYELTRARPWRSLALVPVDDGPNMLGLAHQLALLASQDPRHKVLVVNGTGMVANEGRQHAGNNPYGNSGIVPAAGGRYGMLDCAKLGMDEATIGNVEVPKHVEAMRRGESPFSLMLVATTSLLTRPASVSSARAVDTVLVCVALGFTTFKSARRTIELVGEENVAGSLALRPRG
jgi:hypothetical protein